MRITPFNLVFALILGYFAVRLLDIQHMHRAEAKQLIFSFKIWHGLLLLAILIVDVIFRAAISDTKKLWLVESLFIVFIAGVIQILSIITGTSLFI